MARQGGEFTELNNQVTKLIVEGFNDIREEIAEIDKKVDGVNSEVHEIKKRLFGDEATRTESLIDEVKASENRSHENRRRLNSIEPEHDKMYKAYIRFWGTIMGVSVVFGVIGAAILKLITFIFS